jgi:hypothetical protein
MAAPAIAPSYGNNTAQVSHFLQCLRWLTPSEWRQVTEASLASGPVGGLGVRLDAWDAAAEACSEAERAAWAVAEPAMVAARLAVLGLVLRDRLTNQQFMALYAPFATVIPLQELEQSKSPKAREARDDWVENSDGRVRRRRSGRPPVAHPPRLAIAPGA